MERTPLKYDNGTLGSESSWGSCYRRTW
jgi:hypothetical protein